MSAADQNDIFRLPMSSLKIDLKLKWCRGMDCIHLVSVNKPNWSTNFPYMFISILYMFLAAMCPSSGEKIVSMRHLVYVTMCIWPSGMQVGMKHSDLHTRKSYTQSDIYQVSHWYNLFSWWWTHDCPYWNKSNKMQQLRLFFAMALLYMFRLTIPPIIRSTYAVYGLR